MTRLFVAMAMLLSVAACSGFKDLAEVPEPMGRFLLGHNIVVSKEPMIGPLSREASDEEWIASITAAVDERFSRYDGDKFFHIAVRVEGYSLGRPGIPVVASPKSVLIIGVTLWEDATQQKINDEPKRIIAFERFSAETFISSGLTQTREQQMLNLSRSAAEDIHDWMLKNPQWFGDAALMDPSHTSAGRPAISIDPAEAEVEVGVEVEVEVEVEPAA